LTGWWLCALPLHGLLLGTWLLAAQPEALLPAEATGLEAAHAIEQALQSAIEAAEKSVVAIARVRIEPAGEESPSRQLITPPALAGREPHPTDPEFEPNEYGSGVVIDAKGLILTNYHVLGNPQNSKYYVWIQRRPFPATLFAADPWYDLAVLRIDARGLHPITFADGGPVRKGQIVLALGNPQAIARDGQPSVSWGIVSNVLRRAPGAAAREDGGGRETIHHYGTLIQTDAKLNFGYSGGALINLQGQMVGLTTSFAAGIDYETAAGFAIPVDEGFRRVVDALQQGRKPDFGFLGIAPEPNELALRQRGIWGARVVEVYAGTPASDAGLRRGDLIVQINDQPVFDDHDMIRLVGALEPESVAVLRVVRWHSVSRLISTGIRGASQIELKLSKKHVAGVRPQVGEDRVQIWRGMRVDYATAAPNFRELVDRIDPTGCVLVREVTADSPAWHAGLRAGDLVSHVGEQQIKTPWDFLGAVAEQHGEVSVRVIAAQATTEVRRIAPEN
jgi:serine protease Do